MASWRINLRHTISASSSVWPRLVTALVDAVSFGMDTLADSGKFAVAVMVLLAPGHSVCLCTDIAWPLAIGSTNGNGV
jgi:hypothetical protein